MEYKQITYHDIRENPEVTALMERGNDMLGVLGYTEHSKKHACKVARGASDILKALGHDKRGVRAGAHRGLYARHRQLRQPRRPCAQRALLAFQILRGLDMPPDEVACVVSAIGQHDEKTGTAVDRCPRRSSLRTRATCAATACATASRRRLTSTTASITPPCPRRSRYCRRKKPSSSTSSWTRTSVPFWTISRSFCSAC